MSSDNTSAPVDADTTRTVLMCSGHSRPVVHLSYSNIVDDSFWIISACKDGKPMIRNGVSGDWVGTLEGHKGAVWWAKFDPDATKAVTASADFTAKVWDAVTGSELCSFMHAHIVKTVDFSKDGTKVITGGMEKVLKIFDLNAPSAPPQVIDAHTQPVKVVVWLSPTAVASSGQDNTLKIWDLRTMQPSTTISTANPITSLEASRFSNGRYLTATSGKRVSFYDTHTMSVVKEKEFSSEIESASLSSDCKSFVTGGSDFWVRLNSFDTVEEIECHKGHHGPVHTIEFAPNNQSYASGSEDGTIRIWPHFTTANTTTAHS